MTTVVQKCPRKDAMGHFVRGVPSFGNLNVLSSIKTCMMLFAPNLGFEEVGRAATNLPSRHLLSSRINMESQSNTTHAVKRSLLGTNLIFLRSHAYARAMREAVIFDIICI